MLKKKNVLFQISTLKILLERIFNNETTLGELKKHGDFGLGTLNGADGELVGINGEFYHVNGDGVTYLANDEDKTPMAVVTFFQADESILLNKMSNYENLIRYLEGILPSKNIFYAIKIEGYFNYIKVRSGYKQTEPYPSFDEVINKTSIFEYSNIEGTMVGFYCPNYLKEINSPGYHFHFIAKDKMKGGHLHDFKAEELYIEYSKIQDFHVELPRNIEFFNKNLTAELLIKKNSEL